MQSTPPLLHLRLQTLRSEVHAEEKNRLMMQRLAREEWFLAYRKRLKEYRAAGGARPVYPTERMEAIEQEVDAQMREKYPGYIR